MLMVFGLWHAWASSSHVASTRNDAMQRLLNPHLRHRSVVLASQQGAPPSALRQGMEGPSLSLRASHLSFPFPVLKSRNLKHTAREASGAVAASWIAAMPSGLRELEQQVDAAISNSKTAQPAVSESNAAPSQCVATGIMTEGGKSQEFHRLSITALSFA